MFEIKLNIDVTERTVELVKSLTTAFTPVQAQQAVTAPEPKKEQAKADPEPEKKTTSRNTRKSTTAKTAQKPEVEPAKAIEEKEETPAPGSEAAAEEVPSKEDLRKIAVKAIQKNKQAVVAIKSEHWPDEAKITTIPENDRAKAIKLLNEVIAG